MPPLGGAPPPPPPMPPMGGAPPPPPMPPMGGAPPVGMAAGGFVGDNSGFGGGGGSGNFGGGGGMGQQFTNQQPMNQQFMSQQPMQPMGQQYTSPYPMPPMQPMGQQNSVNGYQGISAMTPHFADGGYVGAGSNFGGSNGLGAYDDDGGMVNPGADYGGGITALDLPDSMFAEPSDGGYANGGIVAFQAGSPGKLVDDPDYVDYEDSLLGRYDPIVDRGAASQQGKAFILEREAERARVRNEIARRKQEGYQTPAQKTAAARQLPFVDALSEHMARQRAISERGTVELANADKGIGNTLAGVFGSAVAGRKRALDTVPTIPERITPRRQETEKKPASAPTTLGTVANPIPLTEANRGTIPQGAYYRDATGVVRKNAPRVSETAPVAPRAPVRGLGAAARTLPPGAPGAVKKEEAATDVEKSGYEKMLAGGYADRQAAVDDMRKMMGGGDARPANEKLRKQLDDVTSEKAEKASKEERLWTAMAQIGSGLMASKSPNFLQAVGDSMKEALPDMIKANKERKAEVRESLKDQAALENMDRQEKALYVKEGLAVYDRYTDVLMKARELANTEKFREASLLLDRFKAESTERYQQASIGATYAGINKAPANIQELNWAVANPEKYAAIQLAKGADSTSPALEELKKRLAGGTGGSNSNPNKPPPGTTIDPPRR